MSNTKTLIIHGWSDCSESFTAMRDVFIGRGIGGPEDIYFVDYESREDDLTYDQIADGLNNRLKQQRLIGDNGERIYDLNFVVHSTGGLVVRHWLAKYYAARGVECPVKRVIMLAPANFGSPLAHRGQSLLGKLVKGRWKVGDLLEVGRKILGGLELASPFQWELAHRDLLVASPVICSSDVQTTVLVGDKDYEGLRGWVNTPGTDGTVVISGAGLNISKLVVDYTRAPPGLAPKRPAVYEYSTRQGQAAFGIVPGFDHGSIVSSFESGGSSNVADLVSRALTTKSPAEFAKLRTDLADAKAPPSSAESPLRVRRPYQQFIFRALDDHGAPVQDYTIEFFFIRKSRWQINSGFVAADLDEWRDEKEREFSRRLNELLLAGAHTNISDSSYRRTLVDAVAMDDLYRDVESAWKDDYVLGGRIHIPDAGQGCTYDTEELQNVIIIDPAVQDATVQELFTTDITMLVELRVRRHSGYIHVSTEPLRH